MVVIVGFATVGVGAGAGLITMLRAFVTLPPLLEALTVKLYVPAALGVPLISPVEDRERPVGKEPLLRLHDTPVPVAVSAEL